MLAKYKFEKANDRAAMEGGNTNSTSVEFGPFVSVTFLSARSTNIILCLLESARVIVVVVETLTPQTPTLESLRHKSDNKSASL